MASLPPNTRAIGTPDPANDMDSIVNVLSVITGASPGGSAVTTQQTLNTIAGAVTNNRVLAGDGTNVTLRALVAGDLPAATTSAQGAIQLDTATPQPTALTGAAGSATKVLPSDHVHAQNYYGIFGDGSDGA